MTLRTVKTGKLEIAYEECGPAHGPAVILLHGFPDDVRTWDGAIGPLIGAGRRVLVCLGIARTQLAGHDWGGRAACIVAALYPDRVAALVSGGGYNLQDIPRANRPADPDQEHRCWYQWYLHTDRGRTGLTMNRRAFCRHLFAGARGVRGDDG